MIAYKNRERKTKRCPDNHVTCDDNVRDQKRDGKSTNLQLGIQCQTKRHSINKTFYESIVRFVRDTVDFLLG